MLGLSEAILGGPHKLSARAVARTELLFVERADLMSYLAKHPGLCMDIVRMLSEDLHGLYHKFRTLSVDPARMRRRGTDGRFN